MIDAYCTKCGNILESWLTESGDCLCVEPCKNQCYTTDISYFEDDEDFIKPRPRPLKKGE